MRKHVALISVCIVAAAVMPATIVHAGESVVQDLCASGPDVDFDGDGSLDVAVADPAATVAGTPNAGRVHIVYGGASGTLTLTAPSSGVAARFGTSLAVFDYNLDGCDDLAVGAPFETVGAVTGTGIVYLYLGTQGGLGSPQVIVQGADGLADTPESGDQFGASLAGGVTMGGSPFLIVGAPGESVGSVSNAGAVFYQNNGQWGRLTEGTSGVEGSVEAGDRWGAVLAASSLHFAVGAPMEDVSDFVDAGNVDVFAHSGTPGTPPVVGFLNQEMEGQSGYAENGDHFGASLSMVSYTSTGGLLKSMLAIGVPGESLDENNASDAGRVVATVTVSTSIETTEYEEIHQGSADVAGAREAGDAFGWHVSLVNRAPIGTAPTWDELLLVVGVPGEDSGQLVDTGDLQMFSMVGTPGEHDTWVNLDVQPGAEGFTAMAQARLGSYFAATPSQLLVSDPLGGTPAVYGVPWANLTEAASVPVTLIKPGLNGVPLDGTGLFGAVVR